LFLTDRSWEQSWLWRICSEFQWFFTSSLDFYSL
jgi:hypothetical protein